MESEKPPAEPQSPTLNLLLHDPAPELNHLQEIIQTTIKAPVDFVICDPGVMRFMNLKWRHIDKPTDVLTFDLSSPDDDVPSGVVYIDGRLAPPLSAVLERLYHGWLHLRGYTHDTEQDGEEMRKLTDSLVSTAMLEAGVS